MLLSPATIVSHAITAVSLLHTVRHAASCHAACCRRLPRRQYHQPRRRNIAATSPPAQPRYRRWLSRGAAVYYVNRRANITPPLRRLRYCATHADCRLLLAATPHAKRRPTPPRHMKNTRELSEYDAFSRAGALQLLRRRVVIRFSSTDAIFQRCYAGFLSSLLLPLALPYITIIGYY